MKSKESKLLKVLSQLCISSVNSTSSGKGLTRLEKYLHVDRKIQKDLIEHMKEVTTQKQKTSNFFLQVVLVMVKVIFFL